MYINLFAVFLSFLSLFFNCYFYSLVYHLFLILGIFGWCNKLENISNCDLCLLLSVELAFVFSVGGCDNANGVKLLPLIMAI